MPLTKAEISKLRSLRLKKNREASGHFVVENPKVIAELLAAGRRIESLYSTPDWEPPDGVAPVPVSLGEMARISHYPTPSSVLAVGHIERATLAAGELDQGYTLALDDVQDPGNVGTLLRIADWFGFDRVLLSPACADLFSQKVINASMGSFVRMRVITTALPPVLSEATVPVLGCDLDGQDLHHYAAPSAAIVVIGSEGRGLSPEVAATLTTRLTIPRQGGAESLNAAVAAGIVCAQLRAASPPAPQSP